MNENKEDVLKAFLERHSWEEIFEDTTGAFQGLIYDILENGLSINSIVDGKDTFLEKPSRTLEGNVITAFCFWNKKLPNLQKNQAGILLDVPKMQEIFPESSSKIADWLIMRERLLNAEPLIYYMIVNIYNDVYGRLWME